jgi:uncharacterized protein YlxW (UPF0749 family)
MNKISQSSDKSLNPDSGATDSLWQPSWWQWLISALSGTVETEKQIAWLKQEKERLKQESEKYSAIAQQTRKETEQIEKETEQLKKENAQIEKETEQLKKENERLAVLESKIDGLFSKYGINSKPANPTEEL